MTLSNGATVRLKPTTFKNNEVLFNAFSLGGEWAYGDTADVNVRLMDQVIEECALGGHTINQLNRMMSGHQLGISFLLNDANEQLKRLNVTWGVGAGFQYKRYFLRGGYDFGLIVPYKSADFVNGNHTRGRLDQWNIKVGVYLWYDED
jgi:hypothetical protein